MLVIKKASIPFIRTFLIHGAVGSLFLNICSVALNLLMAVVLARVMGVKNFGTYVFCLSIAQILTVPAMLGGQQLLVREVAAYQTRGYFHLLRGLLRRIRQASFLTSIILALASAGISTWVYRGSPMQFPFVVAMALVPLYSIIQLQNAALRGLKHVLLGQTAQTLRPVLVISLVGLIFWVTGQRLEAEVALSAQLVSNAALVVVTYVFLQRLLPIKAKTVTPEYETLRWGKSMLPFVFIGGMQILNKQMSVVLLGVLQNPEVVGLYRVAQRGAELVPFGLVAVNMVIAPTVSELFVKGEKARLQRLISKSAIMILAFALPVTLVLIIGGKWLIVLVFGPEYSFAYKPLVILCLGELINAGMGSVGIILNMAGLERVTARGLAISAVASVVLNVSLIPFFGVMGAAIASSSSMVIWNIFLLVCLYKETGLVSTVLPARLMRRLKL